MEKLTEARKRFGFTKRVDSRRENSMWERQYSQSFYLTNCMQEQLLGGVPSK